jgi:hypothetical protein
LLWEIDPDKLTPAQLDKIADHLIAKALGDNPAAIAEMDHPLLAGDSVTFDAVCQAVNEPTRNSRDSKES